MMRYQVKYLKILAPILDTLVNLGFEKFFAYSLFFDRVVEEWTESVVEPLLYCVRNLKNTQILWIFKALIPKSRDCSSFCYGGDGSERKATDCVRASQILRQSCHCIETVTRHLCHPRWR